jgi:hypothetical protein
MTSRRSRQFCDRSQLLTARGARHQVFGLAQVLFQGSWHEYGVPDIDQRNV